METLPSFFSPLRCPRFRLLSESNDYPKGKLSSAGNVHQVSRGRVVAKHISSSTCSIYPSIHLSILLTALPSPHPHSQPLCQPKGGGRASSQSLRNFPVEIYTNFRGLEFYPQCVKSLKRSSPSDINVPFRPLLISFKCCLNVDCLFHNLLLFFPFLPGPQLFNSLNSLLFYLLPSPPLSCSP